MEITGKPKPDTVEVLDNFFQKGGFNEIVEYLKKNPDESYFICSAILEPDVSPYYQRITLSVIIGLLAEREQE